MTSETTTTDPISDAERQELLEGLSRLIADARRLSAKDNPSGHVRFDIQLPRKEQGLLKLSTLAASVMAGRPLTQALVVRLALYRFAQEAKGAVKDPEASEKMKQDIQALRDERLH